ncbi:MAG: hypothetical protein RR812_00235 [Vagococcus sp.]
MDIKKILVITALGLLFLTSAFSISKVQQTNKDSKYRGSTLPTLNKKLTDENKKLLDANTKADKQIDDLAKKYDALNTELTEVKKNTETGY